ncbi:MAG TPA: MerR family transcriptional regulator [Acidimicrobiales bacterium]|nr:MerR family transcriptional regulator [Acidimicrobiales bacterium]
MVGDLNGGYTVEEVAERTGTTIRTVRWYQSEGLLPSPRRAGRVALYTDEHVARLDAIRDLQAHGLTLTAIRRLLDRAPGHAATTALAFAKAAVARTGESDAEIVTAAEGTARLHVDPAETPDGVDEALLEELGMVRVLPDGRWQILAPAVFQAAAELAAAGVPLARRIEVTRQLREHTQVMAHAVVEMFVEDLWRRSVSPANANPEAWAGLTTLLARLRPLATASVAGFFDAALSDEAERAAERELQAGAGDLTAS